MERGLFKGREKSAAAAFGTGVVYLDQRKANSGFAVLAVENFLFTCVLVIGRILDGNGIIAEGKKFFRNSCFVDKNCAENNTGHIDHGDQHRSGDGY